MITGDIAGGYAKSVNWTDKSMQTSRSWSSHTNGDDGKSRSSADPVVKQSHADIIRLADLGRPIPHSVHVLTGIPLVAYRSVLYSYAGSTGRRHNDNTVNRRSQDAHIRCHIADRNRDHRSYREPTGSAGR
jgi:hypothetical protein